MHHQCMLDGCISLKMHDIFLVQHTTHPTFHFKAHQPPTMEFHNELYVCMCKPAPGASSMDVSHSLTDAGPALPATMAYQTYIECMGTCFLYALTHRDARFPAATFSHPLPLSSQCLLWVASAHVYRAPCCDLCFCQQILKSMLISSATVVVRQHTSFQPCSSALGTILPGGTQFQHVI